MLLFKPAPMYILDEVDAALDLSHTQNIGVMLRAHFKASQFIVVSLKEGMFNNANVIFRTKFVDGVSTVKRTIGKGAAASSAAIDDLNLDDVEVDVAAGGSENAGGKNWKAASKAAKGKAKAAKAKAAKGKGKGKGKRKARA